MIDRPEKMRVWVHGQEMRLAFETKMDRAKFIHEIKYRSEQMYLVHSFYVEIYIRPASVDAYQVLA